MNLRSNIKKLRCNNETLLVDRIQKILTNHIYNFYNLQYFRNLFILALYKFNICNTSDFEN
jgi:hypothetical protein